MKTSIAVAALATLLVTGCGTAAPAKPSTVGMTSSEVSSNLTVVMENDADARGLLRGTPACDGPLTNVGDVSLCTVTLTGSGYSGKYVIAVTLIDRRGHFSWSVDHPVG